MTADPLAPLLALPGVADGFAAARSAVDAVLAHRLLRRRSAEVSAEVGLRCARASAALEGVDVPLAELRGGSSSPLVHGALRVSTDLGGLLDTVERAPLQALARLHVLAGRGVVPDEELGRPVADPAVTRRLAGLAELLSNRSTSSALGLAAVVHGELLALGAFPGCNGVVARGAARLVLVARGLDPKAVCAHDVGHADIADDYVTAAAAYAAGDVGKWLRHVAEAVRLGAVESLAICEALVRTAEAQV